LSLRLSVLDQSPIRKGGTPAEAVRDTLELAQLCDRLGYTRYWLAEHHSSEALAGSTPEVWITRVAGLTERIRVGSGGVMLPHYSAYKVAENFRMLETLFPGRIDVGIGRAPGSDQHTMRILADGKPNWSDAEKYPYQVRDLVAWLHDALPLNHEGTGVVAQPTGETAPDVWLLGSSDDSAALAAHFGGSAPLASICSSSSSSDFTCASASTRATTPWWPWLPHILASRSPSDSISRIPASLARYTNWRMRASRRETSKNTSKTD